MIDVQMVLRAFVELEAYVCQHAELREFAHVAQALRRAAEQFAQGTPELEFFGTSYPAPRVPTVEHAREIVRIIGQVPTIDGDETTSCQRGFAILNANLVDGIMHDIFARYPEVVPRERGTESSEPDRG